MQKQSRSQHRGLYPEMAEAELAEHNWEDDDERCLARMEFGDRYSF